MAGDATADVRSIWQAGVEAVDSGRLVRAAVRCDGTTLEVCGRGHSLEALERLIVVGGGKAGAGMAAAIEDLLPADFLQQRVSGWVNVPADCVKSLASIQLHAARPAGVNEPTVEGVAGSKAILDLVGGASENDLVLVLISGGGSALLPAPCVGISLEDKLAVTRLLMLSGASINQLNCVRKRLSALKGGNLARAAQAAGAIQGLLISDVIGDPLDIIASGPTVADGGTDRRALKVLKKFASRYEDVPEVVWRTLEARAGDDDGQRAIELPDSLSNHVIGNNEVAVAAAGDHARSLGYHVHSLGSENQGIARDQGVALLDLCRQIRAGQGPVEMPACVISGGEPLVELAQTDQPRRGGRNQELVLAVLEAAWDSGLDRIAILSGGTDGEDGPTDAAGAIVDQDLWRTARTLKLHPEPFLAINDSYTYFEATGGLLKTGPTHTNVMDLRVAILTP
jgi:glycerate 2-kinase